MKRILVVFCLSFLLSSSSTANDLIHRLKSEAPKSWQALEEASHSLEMAATCTISGTIGEKPAFPPFLEKWTYKRNGRMQLFEKLIDEREPTSEGVPGVFATNSEYGFKLTQDSQSQRWVIREAGAGFRDAQVVELFVYMQALHVADASWMLPYGFLPAQCVAMPKFKILSARSVETPAKSQHLHFEFSLDLEPGDYAKVIRNPDVVEKQGGEFSQISGSFVVDPANYWAIVHSELQFIGRVKAPPAKEAKLVSGHAQSTIEYAFASSTEGPTIPVPASVVFSYGQPGSLMTTQARVTQMALRAIPEEEFRLTAYSFPEPFARAQPKSAASYFFIAANVLAILALIAARVRFRRAH